MQELINKISKIKGIIIEKDVLLKNYTNFKIGGNAKLMCKVYEKKSLIKLLKLLTTYKQKYFILGNGTNLLCSDNGYDGVVIYLGHNLNKLKIKGKKVYCQSGLSLFKLNKECAKAGLSGLEFSYGIPGSVGGAIKMNAGAYGGSISDVLKCVWVFNGKKVVKIKKEKLNFAYRHSVLSENNWTIISACFKLKNGNSEEINAKINEIFNLRLSKQPYDKPSAGSVFKRNDNFIISKIIDDLGLKGYKIGGAEISTKHAGFIINSGDATCNDVLNLIKYIKEKIYNSYGFVPQLEIELMGDFDEIIRWLSHSHNL